MDDNEVITTNKVVSHFKREMNPVRPHLQAALDKGDPELVMECLTGKQLAFVEEYLKDLNAAAAVRRVGYTTTNAKQIGSQLLSNPGVRFAIDYLKTKRAENSDVTSDYVLKEVFEIIEKTKTKNPNAALRGLELLAKHLGMLKDKVEMSGPDGAAIEYEQRVQQDSTDFASAIARLAKRQGADGVDGIPLPGAASQP